jgi:hypothetical protein
MRKVEWHLRRFLGGIGTRTQIPHGEVKHAPLQPHMSAGETRLYASLLDVATEYLEYGCGGSTILAAERPLLRSTSIDSDPNWITALRQQKLIEAAEDEGRLRLLHVDIGPVAEWGRPKDMSRVKSWPEYSQRPWLDAGYAPDFIFIDGRFRVACALEVILHMRENAVLAIHDFWNRPDYHPVLPYLVWLASVDTLGVFKRRENIALASITTELNRYHLDPA